MPSELRLAAMAATPTDAPATTAEIPPPALLLTADELAKELRVSPKTLRRLDAAGKIPRAIKIGRAKRWPRETIVRWIASGGVSRRDFEAFYAPRQRGRA